jgi:hypothetical protein
MQRRMQCFVSALVPIQIRNCVEYFISNAAPDQDPRETISMGFHADSRYRPETVRHEQEISNADRDKCKPVLLRLSLAGNLEKPLCPSMGPNGGSVLWAQNVDVHEHTCRPSSLPQWEIKMVPIDSSIHKKNSRMKRRMQCFVSALVPI